MLYLITFKFNYSNNLFKTVLYEKAPVWEQFSHISTFTYLMEVTCIFTGT